jgi:hypothetical protein
MRRDPFVPVCPKQYRFCGFIKDVLEQDSCQPVTNREEQEEDRKMCRLLVIVRTEIANDFFCVTSL